jgi:D-arabinose 1-dehydrogenase-like Zn-dependent alcohol dehydrogenase
MGPTTYRAYQAVGGGKLELIDRPAEEPAARIEAYGACHTDTLTVEGGFPGMKYPRVPGHKAVGRIDALGAGSRAGSSGNASA